MAGDQALNLKRLTASAPPRKVVASIKRDLKLCRVRPVDFTMRQLAIELVRTVAVVEKGWPVGDYIDLYADRSQLWVVKNGEDVVGTVLIIEGDPLTFPIRSTEAWPNLQLPKGTSAEIPFVVVDKKFRGSSGVSYMLCAACHWYFFESDLEYMELTLDEQLYSFYLWHGMAMQKVSEEDGGGEKFHWGESGIFPARLYVGDPDNPCSMGYSIKMKRPEMWEVFMHNRLR